jgi:hypothetical protein
MFSFSKKYIQLGQGILPREQKLLEQSIQAALSPMLPTDRFVVELERDLIQEAMRQERYVSNAERGWRLVGFIGGGLLSIAGGILVWVIWQHRHTAEDAGEAMSSSKRRSLFRASGLSTAMSPPQTVQPSL